MVTVKFRSGKRSKRVALAESGVLVIAVDLGFSNRGKSCGIAWRPQSAAPASTLPKAESLRFDECIQRVARLVYEDRKAVLIIEAPLSAVFDVDGNPVGRGDFEKSEVAKNDRTRGGRDGKESPRYWYYGAGASTCLAAIFFLRRLTRQGPPVAGKTTEIILFEGFISYKRRPVGKTTPKARRTNISAHAEEARQLLGCFLDEKADSAKVRDVEKPKGGVVIPVTSILEGSQSATAPAIIMPSKEERSSK
jgi:hypothetical protein